MLMRTNPFNLLRQLTSDMDRLFAAAPRPEWRDRELELEAPAMVNWVPGIDVFEAEGRLVTRIDLPGLKKEDVKVEVTEGSLVISGERKREVEEKHEQFFRREREYGQFYRAVPLPEGVNVEDIKAVFADGVLDVSIPLPAARETKVKRVLVEERPKEVKPAA